MFTYHSVFIDKKTCKNKKEKEMGEREKKEGEGEMEGGGERSPWTDLVPSGLG